MSLLKRRRHGRKPRKPNLQCENLESRYLLTTFTVNSGEDVVDANDGVTTLREAVNQANAEAGPDIIVIDPNTPTNFEEVVIFLDSEIEITDDLDIQGLSQFEFVIVGNQGIDEVGGDGDRIFTVNDSSPNVINVRISDMIIQSGDPAGNGGAIYSEESLTIERVTGGGNNAQSSGGFLFASVGEGATLIVDDSRITGNSTEGEGGGISANVYGGTVEIRNSTVTGNVASDGGGIYIYGDDVANNIVVSNADVTGNDADNGGGLSLVVGSGNVTVEESFINGNTARDGGGLSADISTDAEVTIRNTIVSDNVGDENGGIRASSKGDLSVIGSRISGNSTGEDGSGVGGISVALSDGGEATIDSSVVSQNTSTTAGGVEVSFDENSSTTATIVSSTISGNTAESGSAIRTTNSGELNIRHSTIAKNVNTTADTSAVFADSATITIDHSIIADHAADLGTSSGTFNISHSLIGTNAGSGLTAAPVGSPDANGNIIGGATPIDPLLSELGTNGGTSDTHALLPGSPAIDAGDQDIVSPPSFDQRGNPFIRRFDGDNDGTTTIDIGAYERISSGLIVSTADDGLDGDYSDGNLSLREAIQLAADSVSTTGKVTFASDLSGQTLDLTEGQISILNPVEIEGPGAASLTISAAGNDPTPTTDQGDGTRIFNIDDNDDNRGLAVTISGVTLSDGDVTGAGGAIQSREDLTLRDSIITGNNAAQSGEQVGYEGDGGGVWARTFTGSILFDNVEIVGNTSDDDGGGLNILAGTGLITIQNSTISDNTANGLGTIGVNVGGGIRGFANEGGEIAVVDSMITDNVGQRLGIGDSWGGGGIGFVGSGKLSVRSSTISGNTSDTFGGGIYIEGSYSNGVTLGEFEIVDSVISNNNASLGGGVGALFNATGVIENTTLDGNEASDGGGLFNLGNVDVVNSTLSGNSAGFGGGIMNGYLTQGSAYAGELDVLNSTISGNEAEFGGGIFTLVLPSTTSTIRHSTIVNNKADANADDQGTGGGVYAFYGALDIDHSIIAKNTVTPGGAPDMQIDPGGVGGATAVITVTNSLIGDNTGLELPESARDNDSWLQNEDGNYVGGPEGGVIDPLIGDLADNGGPTETHALEFGSLAIDAGNESDLVDLPVSDQRGEPFVRVADGALDMGAFESQDEPTTLLGDFDGDDDFDCSDIDALVIHIRDGGSDSQFDLNEDGSVDDVDIDQWLTIAGNANQGRPYLSGDANLNGITDAQDLNVLGQVWLQSVSGWCAGDLNGDGLVNAIDLNRVGQAWLQDGAPDPAAARAPQAALAAVDVIDEAIAAPADRSLECNEFRLQSVESPLIGDMDRIDIRRVQRRHAQDRIRNQSPADVAATEVSTIVDQLLATWLV